MGSGFNLYCWSGIHFSWSNSLIFCCCIFRRCFCKFRNFITIFDFLFIILFHTSLDIYKFINLRVSEVHLFYNLQLFYWHFLEILWLFIFLGFYKSQTKEQRETYDKPRIEEAVSKMECQ